MTDVVDAATRSRMMAGIKGKDTTPELFLRYALHAKGFRYCLGGRGLPGKPDLVFPGRSVVIFVHGCFWHCHDCKYFKWPKSNTQFWLSKLKTNTQRDLQVALELKKQGWHVLTVWECELKATHYQLPNASVTKAMAALTKMQGRRHNA
ncbi:MAG: very short patch repair endonuclease [Pseudomonadota bacterium]